MAKKISFKTRSQITNEEIIIAEGVLGETVIEHENYYYVSPEALTHQVEEMINITDGTPHDQEKGVKHYVNLVNPDTNEIIKPKIAWIYHDTAEGMEHIIDKYGFSKISDNAVTVEEVNQ